MTQPKRIALLGGGMAGLTAAFYLTSRQGWERDYDITLYQRGWRLGGKAASGHNAERGHRNEPVGATHVWGGSYENAFGLMRACYEELDRPPSAVFRHLEDAFSPKSLIYLQERRRDGSFEPWPILFPLTSRRPGIGQSRPDIFSVIAKLIGWSVEAMRDFPLTEVREQARAPQQRDALSKRRELLPAWLSELARDAARVVGKIFDGSPFWMLYEAWKLAERLQDEEQSLASDLVMVADYLGRFLLWIEDRFLDEIEQDDSARRIYTLLALSITVARGLITDNVLHENYYVLDDYDLRDWLERHGAREAILQSAPVKACYDYFYAYRQGDHRRPALAAGVALNHMIKLIGAYKGAIFWSLNAGAGAVVFAPLYEVLKARGVKFEFFAQVEALELDASRGRVERVRMSRQAHVAGGGEYEPLISVAGVSCWPSAPLYKQLEGGEALAELKADFEARQGRWALAEPFTLEREADFDVVLCAMSLGEVEQVASQLIASRRDWASMIDQVETAPTISARLDFTRDRVALGWRGTDALLGAYVAPFQSFEDRSETLQREAWSDTERPALAAEYSGPFPAEADASLAHQHVARWLDERCEAIFPEARDPGDSARFDYDALTGPEGAAGSARLDAHWVRVNDEAGARQVLSLPKTSRFRLSADTSGYGNLVLAGDWLYTGMGATIEGACMSGMMASRALCHHPTRIAWEIAIYPWQREISVHPLIKVEPDGEL